MEAHCRLVDLTCYLAMVSIATAAMFGIDTADFYQRVDDCPPLFDCAPKARVTAVPLSSTHDGAPSLNLNALDHREL